ncbi:hypothetical protein [Pandoraea sp. CB10b_02]|uniref:hypothetical protein n=1 Tax=Pandoraea sp. CB10b_02 TaxID=2014535 RepID=UPI00257E9866|nr:hypothetical protein [Pandoraea sp. CB10b_02]
MSTLKISEAGTVQFPMVKHAVEIGWTSITPEDARTQRGGEAGTFFRDVLEAKLAAFNPWMSADAVRSVVETLDALPAKDALDRLPPLTLVQVMTDTVDGVTLGGEDHAPELIDDLVDSYEVENVLGQQVLFSNPSGYCTPGESAREVELMDLAKRSRAASSKMSSLKPSMTSWPAPSDSSTIRSATSSIRCRSPTPRAASTASICSRCSFLGFLASASGMARPNSSTINSRNTAGGRWPRSLLRFSASFIYIPLKGLDRLGISLDGPFFLLGCADR